MSATKRALRPLADFLPLPPADAPTGGRKSHSVAQAQAILEVSGDHIRSLIASGQLAAFDVSLRPGSKRRTWRIPDSALTDFIARRTARKPEPRPTRRRARKEGSVLQFF